LEGCKIVKRVLAMTDYYDGVGEYRAREKKEVRYVHVLTTNKFI